MHASAWFFLQMQLAVTPSLLKTYLATQGHLSGWGMVTSLFIGLWLVSRQGRVWVGRSWRSAVRSKWGKLWPVPTLLLPTILGTPGLVPPYFVPLALALVSFTAIYGIARQNYEQEDFKRALVRDVIEALAERERAIEETDRAIAETDRAIAETDRAIAAIESKRKK